MTQFSRALIFLMTAVGAALSQEVAYGNGIPPSSARVEAGTKPTGKTVARVNGVALTDVDLAREMLAMFPYARQHGGKIPAAFEANIRQGALAMIEFEELVYQEAQRRKMQISSERLNRSLTEYKRQFGSEADFGAFLAAEFHSSEEGLRKSLRRSLLIDDLLEMEVTRKLSIRPEGVRAYYDKNRTRYHVPRKAAIQTISIVIPDEATKLELAKTRRRADEALRQAKATQNAEEFGVLAEKISDDDWRVMMGDHGAIELEKMPAAVAQRVFNMKPGQVSDLIEAENSHCIVRLNVITPARQMPFEEVRAQIRKDLEAQRVDQLRRALNQRLRRTAKVEESF